MGVEVKGAGDGVVRLNRVIDAQRDQNIVNQVVAALKTGTTTPA